MDTVVRALGRVCVVVPAYNAGRHLADALASLQAQTFDDWECVVVDDGSTDDTAAVARRFVEADRRFRLVQQPNGGSSLARNAGVAEASTAVEHVAFLDADDAWLPDTLAVLVAHLAGHPEAAGVYGLAEYIDDDGEPLLPGLHPMRQRDRRRIGRVDFTGLDASQPYTFSSLTISGTLWPASVALHRRAAFDAVGGFDPVMRQLQDWELYVRMSRHGPFVPVERQVAWYRQHPGNITKRSERVAYYSLLVRWKTWRSPDNTPQQRRESERVWRRLTARWLIRSAVGEAFAWRRGDVRVAFQALRAAWFFGTAFLRGHPQEPDARTTRLFETFVTGADREGRRDADLLTRAGGR